MSFKQFDGYRWNWTPSANQLTITPDRANSRGRLTAPFGLGNSIIRLNLDNLPDKLIQPVTDESTGQGLIPTSPFGLTRWYAMPENINPTTVPLTGFSGWQGNLSFPQANGGSVKQVVSAPIIQNGYGCEEIVGDAPRLYW